MLKHLLTFQTIINIVLLLILSFASHAADDLLDIRSDKLTIDKEKNISSFEGNVFLEFKDIILKTNKIKIYFESDKKQKKKSEKLQKIVVLEKFIAYKGNVEQIKSGVIGKDTEIIYGNFAEYIHNEKKLIIKGQAKIVKDNNIITADELIYFTDITKIHDKEDLLNGR